MVSFNQFFFRTVSFFQSKITRIQIDFVMQSFRTTSLGDYNCTLHRNVHYNIKPTRKVLPFYR